MLLILDNTTMNILYHLNLETSHLHWSDGQTRRHKSLPLILTYLFSVLVCITQRQTGILYSLLSETKDFTRRATSSPDPSAESSTERFNSKENWFFLTYCSPQFCTTQVTQQTNKQIASIPLISKIDNKVFFPLPLLSFHMLANKSELRQRKGHPGNSDPRRNKEPPIHPSPDTSVASFSTLHVLWHGSSQVIGEKNKAEVVYPFPAALII